MIFFVKQVKQPENGIHGISNVSGCVDGIYRQHQYAEHKVNKKIGFFDDSFYGFILFVYQLMN